MLQFESWLLKSPAADPLPLPAPEDRGAAAKEGVGAGGAFRRAEMRVLIRPTAVGTVRTR
jgi:hypothetical protein